MASDEARVIVLMQPELRDTIKTIGRSQGRVLMRQIEHICKEYAAKHAPTPTPHKRNK